MGIRRLIITGDPESTDDPREVKVEYQVLLPLVGWAEEKAGDLTDENDVESVVEDALDTLDAA